jgi:uncharacterized coiled-coil protein SlyX
MKNPCGNCNQHEMILAVTRRAEAAETRVSHLEKNVETLRSREALLRTIASRLEAALREVVERLTEVNWPAKDGDKHAVRIARAALAEGDGISKRAREIADSSGLRSDYLASVIEEQMRGGRGRP